MNKRIKWTLGIVAGFAALYLAVAYITGGVAERHLEKLTAHPILETYQTRIELTGFDRGLLSSIARFEIEIPRYYSTLIKEYAPDTDIGVLRLTYQVDHGPLIFSGGPLAIAAARIHGRFEGPLKEAVSDWPTAASHPAAAFSDAGFSANMRIDIGFAGNAGLHASSRPVAATNADGDAMEIGAFDLDWSLHAGGSHNRLDLKFGGGRLARGDAFVALEPISMAWNMDLLQPYVWLGTSQFRLDGFQLESADISFALGEMNVDSNAALDPEDGLVGFGLDIDMSGFNMPREAKILGPAQADIVLDDLTPEAYQLYMQMNSAIMNAASGDIFATPVWDEATVDQLVHAFTTSGPDLSIKDLNVMTWSGAVRGDLSIGLIASDDYSRDDPEGLARGMTGTGVVYVARTLMVQVLAFQIQIANMSNNPLADKEALQLAGQQISQFVQSGLITAEGDDLVLQYEIDGGIVSVNGRPVADLGPLAAE